MKPYLPPIFCAIIILVLSVMPSIQLPEKMFSTDKLGHLAAYGVLTWLLLRALQTKDRFNPKAAFWAVMATSVYGALLELAQWGFFPYRFFELGDMFANLTGACLSWLVFNFTSAKRRSMEND